MFSKLLKKKRSGEDASSSDRSDRFLKQDGHWYFRTREGFEVGPFANRSDAQYALLYFVESHDWPTEAQLKDFIEGCKLMAGSAA